MRVKAAIILISLASCTVDTGGEHLVAVEDSTQTIDVRTSFDRVMEICGILTRDGQVLPYENWSDTQKECVEVLDVDPQIFEQLPEDFN